MSSRERSLLIILGVAVFLIAHVAAAKLFFIPQLNKAKASAQSFREKAQTADAVLGMRDQLQDEMDWLAKYEPAAMVAQNAESQLENFANSEALKNGLKVKRRKLQAKIVEPGLNFHRARVELEVSGSERVLYRWLDRLHSPPDFRAVTSMRLNPKKDDDTQVDCRVTVEQWFVPMDSGS